jgi:hypothetical protein
MDRRVLCESLIKWVLNMINSKLNFYSFFFDFKMKTLNLNRTIHGAGDLSDGVSIGICLKNMFV